MSKHIFYTSHEVTYMFSLTNEEGKHIKDKEFFKDVVERPDGSYFVKYFDCFDGEFKYDTLIDFITNFEKDMMNHFEYHKNKWITLMKTHYEIVPTGVEYFTKNYEMKQMKGFLS